MKDQLITFETAVLAKEKGFDIVTMYHYYEDEIMRPEDITNWNTYGEEFTSAPTQSLLQRWLREKYFIFIDISTGSKDEFGVIFGFEGTPTWIYGEDGDPIFYNTYEDALEAGLLESLKLIK